jgi:hypothetical protein
MKSGIKLLVAFVLVFAALSQPTRSAAADVNHFARHAVSAAFGGLDPSGCIYTGVDLTAAEQIDQSSPGTRESSGWIFIHIFQADFCNNTVIHTASANEPLSESELEFTGRLNGAKLHTTVTLFDFNTNIPFEVTVDLMWTVNSSQLRDHINSHFNFEGCHFVFNDVASHRFADVSGTVTEGATNLTPAGSLLGGIIFTVRSHQVAHGCD